MPRISHARTTQERCNISFLGSPAASFACAAGSNGSPISSERPRRSKNQTAFLWRLR